MMLILSISIVYDLKYNIMRSLDNDTAPPYNEYSSTCYEDTNFLSSTLFILSTIQVGCFIILFILLLILSIKTHNIRRTNFKETERTNIFIMIFFIYYLFSSLTTIGDFKDMSYSFMFF